MNNILDDVSHKDSVRQRRNRLIPMWMRVSSWFFMGLSVMIPAILSFTMYKQMALYQKLHPDEDSFSSEIMQGNLIALTLFSFLMLLSGITGYAILSRRRWAYLFGIVFSMVSIVIFSYAAVYNFSYSILAVMALLIFFLQHLWRNRRKWEQA